MAASSRLSRIPVVVILGATGTGKSKLAIEICSQFNGEVISADSMQIYKGLDVITNKVTDTEQRQCRHYCLSYVDPLYEHHTVVEYRNRTLPIIDRLLAQQTMPVIVGGTNYYIESLLWKSLMPSGKEDASCTENKDTLPDETLLSAESIETLEDSTKHSDECDMVRKCLESKTDEELYKKLMEVDPAMSKIYHPSNRRKILRALEVFEQTGVTMSDHMSHQRSLDGAVPPLRYCNTCIIWIRCDSKVLDARVNKRVDSMMDEGLIEELTQFHASYIQYRKANGTDVDYTKGIFQSIGLKEFHNYLMLSTADRKSESGHKTLKEGIESLKLATRQYVRRQLKWIRSRYMKRSGDNVPRVYPVDSTHVDQWNTDVLEPACNIVDAFIKGEESRVAPIPYKETDNPPIHEVCDVCGGTIFVRKLPWEEHLKSRKHRKCLQRRRREEERQMMDNS